LGEALAWSAWILKTEGGKRLGGEKKGRGDIAEFAES